MLFLYRIMKKKKEKKRKRRWRVQITGVCVQCDDFIKVKGILGIDSWPTLSESVWNKLRERKGNNTV
jgi:hypothetical protein